MFARGRAEIAGLHEHELQFYSWLLISHSRNSPGLLGERRNVTSAASPNIVLEKEDTLSENHSRDGRARMASTSSWRANFGGRKPSHVMVHSLADDCSSGSPGAR